MVTTWTLYKGDTQVVKQQTITLSDGVTIRDLTNLTVTMKVYKADPNAPFLNEAITVVAPAANGVVQWTVSSSDALALPVDLDGYTVRFTLTGAGGYRETTDPFTLLVEPAPTV